MSDEVQGNVPEEETIFQQSTDIFSSEEVKQELVDYLVKELSELDTNAGRKTRMERNEKIKRQRLGRPAQESKTTPWDGASNVVPPMLLQKVNAVATKMVTTLLEKKPLFTYEADAPWEKHADAITKHVQKLIESPYGIDLYKKIWPIVYDAVSLGSKFLKVPFKVDRLKFNRKGGDGAVEQVDRIIKALPQVEAIPFEDFMIRPEWTDLQTAPWCAVRYYKYFHQLKALELQGYYTDVDLIIDQSKPLDDTKKADLENMGLSESGATEDPNRLYKIYEAHVFWDADGDGYSEDLIVTLEVETGTILRAEYNDLGIRNYSRIPYIELPDSLYGLGVGDMLTSMQDEVETMHNMRIDSQHLTLNPVQVVSETADIEGNIEVRPGKVIKTANPREDYDWKIMPDVTQGALQSEQFTQMYADKATGASQAMSGGDVGGSNRIGATGTQTLLSQSLGFLDAIAVQLAHRLPEIAMLILYQLVRNGDLIQLEGLDEADQILLQDVYSMDVEDIPGTFKFRARLSAVSDSKIAKQQAATQFYQMYKDYIMTSGQFAAQLSNPELGNSPKLQEIMMSGLVGLNNLMEHMLENFDEDNVGDYTFFAEDMKMILKEQDSARLAEVKNFEARSSGAESQSLGATLPDDPTTDEGLGGVGNAQGAEPGAVQGADVAPGSGAGIGGEPV